MNRDIEARIAAQLRDLADEAVTPRSMADPARRRARRIRTRRQVVAVGLAAVVTAVAVPTAVSLGGLGVTENITPQPADTGPSEEPAPTPAPSMELSPAPNETPSSDPDEPAGPVVALSLDDLPAGAAPSIDWTDAQTLHTADGRDLAIPEDMHDARAFGDDVIGGYFPAESAAGTIVQRSDGTVARYPGSRPAFSEDGDLVSWYDATADEIRFERSDGMPPPEPIAGSEGVDLAPVGFLGDETLVSNLMAPEWPPTGARSDTIGGEQSTPWPYVLEADAASERAQLVVGLTEVRDDVELQTSLFAAGSTEPIWRTWEYDFEQFSPDGSLLLGTHAYRDGAGDPFAVVVDVGTGEPVRRFDVDGQGYLTDMVFENDGNILVILNAENAAGVRSAIVRCSIEGVCERATEVRQVSQEELSLQRFDLPR